MVFTLYLGSVSNIPIEDIVYAYDSPDGTVLLLECNHLIYIGQKMSDSLLNPIQVEQFDVHVDKRPKWYNHNGVGCQSLHFPDGTIIPILYEGVLPYISICRCFLKSNTFDD